MEDYEYLEYDNRWNESGWYESMKSGGPALVGCWAVSGIGVAQGVTRLPVLTASQSTESNHEDADDEDVDVEEDVNDDDDNGDVGDVDEFATNIFQVLKISCI